MNYVGVRVRVSIGYLRNHRVRHRTCVRSTAYLHTNETVVRYYVLHTSIDRNPACLHCPGRDCGIVLLIPQSQLNHPSSSTPGLEKIPASGICVVGHTVCMSCQSQGHAPSSCDQWSRWRKIVGKQLGEGDSDGRSAGISDVANTLWLKANTRGCPKCSTCYIYVVL